MKEFITKKGYIIFYEDNEVGGRTYYSDEIGGGVLVWDTALVDIDTLEEVIQYEQELRKN